MKTYEKLARFIELNDDGPQSCLNTTFTEDHKRKIPLTSIIMENEAFIIKSIKQPNQLYAKHVWSAKRMVVARCNACIKQI